MNGLVFNETKTTTRDKRIKKKHGLTTKISMMKNQWWWNMKFYFFIYKYFVCIAFDACCLLKGVVWINDHILQGK